MFKSILHIRREANISYMPQAYISHGEAVFHIGRRPIFHFQFNFSCYLTDNARYSPGAMPFSARKTRLKLEMLWKPEDMAISVRDRS